MKKVEKNEKCEFCNCEVKDVDKVWNLRLFPDVCDKSSCQDKAADKLQRAGLGGLFLDF